MERDNTTTRRFLEDAGIAPGMRVLEIGCGGGEVTEVLARLVGPAGAVAAIDRSEDMLANARDRLSQAGVDNVQLMTLDVTGDLTRLDQFERDSFDALTGRRVLMYLQDPVGALRRLCRWLREGGLVVFEETDLTMVPARKSPLPAHDQLADWLRKMLVAENANTTMGFDLPATFVSAGLSFEGIRAEAVIEGQGGQFAPSQLLRLVQARLISSGLTTEAEVEALAAELDHQSPDPTTVYVNGMSFCAWGTNPSQ